MNRVDSANTYSKFKIKAGIFCLVVREPLVNFNGTSITAPEGFVTRATV